MNTRHLLGIGWPPMFLLLSPALAQAQGAKRQTPAPAITVSAYVETYIAWNFNKPDKVTASVLYFGGAERPRGAPEGEPWRHLFDSYVTLTISPIFSIQAQVDGGFENTTFGRASWRAGAVSARVKANKWLYIAGRADVLDETVPASRAGSASPLFFPANRVQSLTGTLDARPADQLSIRLEVRRDSAKDPIYFKRAADLPTAKSQTTITFGMTAWF